MADDEAGIDRKFYILNGDPAMLFYCMSTAPVQGHHTPMAERHHLGHHRHHMVPVGHSAGMEAGSYVSARAIGRTHFEVVASAVGTWAMVRGERVAVDPAALVVPAAGPQP